MATRKPQPLSSTLQVPIAVVLVVGVLYVAKVLIMPLVIAILLAII